MLNELTLKNYMSYEKHVFSFKNPSLVSVCGAVGSGKSAMLEAINYVLFGVTKVSTKKLVRITADSMECKLLLTVNDSLYTVRRGIRKSDKGYLDVKLGEEVVASGNPAQNYINELLGVASALFSLTSFFGAGINDTLIAALPSKRLETLQVIANISPFSKFNKTANAERSAIQADINTLKKVIAIKRESLPIVADINKAIKKAQDELDKLIDGISLFAKDRKAVLMEIERVSAFISEREGLLKSINTIESDIEVLKRWVNSSENDVKNKTLKIKKLVSEREGYLHEKETYTDLKILNKRFDLLRERVAGYNASLNVYESGVSLSDTEDVHSCPLCSSEVDENTADIWRKKIIDIKKSLAGTEDEVKGIESDISIIETLNEQIDFLNDEINSLTTHNEGLNNKIIEKNKEITSLNTKLQQSKTRVSKIDSELKDSVDVKLRLTKLDKELTMRHTRQGELEADIKNLKSQLKVREKSLKKIKSDEITLKRNFDKLAAYNLLCEGFSRYGIPFDLLEGLKRRISKEASLLYTYFSDGVIKVLDVELRGKPGVSYVLIDALGERDYELLSTGQKALVGLCIRLAVAFILRSAMNITTDFLILDEIAANLDPKKRDSLVRVITSLLNKYFSQVFMVSHAYIRDVFTDTFSISIDGGKSAVEKI